MSDQPQSDKQSSLTTKGIKSLATYQVVSSWAGLVGGFLFYLLILLPGAIFFIWPLYADALWVWLTLVVALGVTPLFVLTYNTWLLSRRNWLEARPPQKKQTASTISQSTLSWISVDAKLELAIPGIMKIGAASTVRDLAKGEISYPENTLLVTDKGLAFVYIAMPGADNLIAGTSYITSMFNRSGIEDVLSSLLADHSLSQIMAMDSRNWIVPFSSIADMKLSSFHRSIALTLVSGEKRTYANIKKQYWSQLKQLLAQRGYGA